MSDTYGAGLIDELDDEEKELFKDANALVAEEPAEEPVETPVEEPAAEAAPVETPVEKPVEEPAAPVEAEDNDGEEVTEVNGGRFIRHGAFHRQREIAKAEKAKREALEKEMTEYREKSSAERARIDERLRILMQAGEQPLPGQPGQQQGAEVPNPEEDPFGYMRYLEQRLNAQDENTQSVQQRIESQDNYTSAKTAFIQDASAFSQKQSDFMQAYTHLMNSRNRELELIGRTDPRERQQIIAQEEFQIVSEAIRQRRSPSELFYALAKDRGYVKQEPAPAAETPAAPAADVRPSAVDQVKAVAAAQATAKSLSSASGGASAPLTAESLANMSEAEFHAVYSKMSRDQRRQYFGG